MKLSSKELQLVKELIKEKIEDIKHEIDILDDNCNTLLVNEDLFNEVEITKEEFLKKIDEYEEILKKLSF
ncbi:hypothetical protein SAMN02745883_01096 [Caminicella sporogenes DSM 14501]|uniref:Uncharacterized protein n=1 Tax=Caminicella sporogenes DSM 14501 TaxID=1121266 RepID=A0A1M6P3U3_9FIRM|nr:hypothetical protein [Caminicella sporogenes]RKD21538.1 hypothetical protein BET04_07365 [Caminicella sporogenes]SHK02645.1 hypothetical protein SAMN02745883_01096 [Caminicella sporogenes DSM 14501]